MTAVEDAIRSMFAAAGAQGWLHACLVDQPAREICVDADVAIPLASVYKVIVLVAYAQAVDDGAIDPAELVTLLPDDRTPGPTGVSMCHDAVTMSWRDLVTSMIVLSDNAAADAVVDRVGASRITATIGALGLRRTTFMGGTADGLRALMSDTGEATVADALAAIADLDRAIEPSGYDPLRTSSSTAREMTTLLRALWTNEAASPEQCAVARQLLARRFGPHRLRAGFAVEGVEVADKTGTLGALAHDVAVVRFPGEGAVAVAVFTRAGRTAALQPRVDAAIGAVARLAVDDLRARLASP